VEVVTVGEEGPQLRVWSVADSRVFGRCGNTEGNLDAYKEEEFHFEEGGGGGGRRGWWKGYVPRVEMDGVGMEC